VEGLEQNGQEHTEDQLDNYKVVVLSEVEGMLVEGGLALTPPNCMKKQSDLTEAARPQIVS
jgi:hypothetical protein